MKQNFNIQKELAEQSDKDWQFGALSVPSLVSIPLAEREKWLPTGETQFDQFADFTDCASRSPVNHLEALFTYHYQHSMLPENKQWLKDNEYVVAGEAPTFDRITFSDRYVAILSGTTRSGNSLKAPLEAIRKQGLIPKHLLPKTDTMTWDEYYDASKITQQLKDLGAEFSKRFTINYEQVDSLFFGEVLKDDMIGVAGYGWPAPVDGVYPPSDLPFNHAFLIYTLPKYQIYDNYVDDLKAGDFTKNLSPEYKLFSYGYRVYISAEQVPSDIPLTVFQTLLKYNLLQYFASWYKRFVGL